MSSRQYTLGLFSLCAVCTAVAEITEWGPATTGFDINQTAHTITITAPGTYYFQSITSGDPDYIQWIRVDAEIAPGTVTVTIARDGGGAGASDVWEIDLSNATTGNLAEVNISGDLATEDDVVCDNITGTVIVGGDVVGLFRTFGDLSHTLEIHGELTATGSVIIDGDVLDAGSNHVQITHMTGGYFECGDMELRNEYIGWMVLGPAAYYDDEELYTVEQTGSIKITGTLSGVLFSRTRCGLTIEVAELNGAEESFPRITYGGIFSLTGFTENSNIDIGTFTRGLINVRGGPLSETYSPQFLGTVDVGTEESPADMGIDDPDNVARIIAWDIFNDEPNAVPIPIGAAIHVWGNIYASLGATSVCQGNLTRDGVDVDLATTGNVESDNITGRSTDTCGVSAPVTMVV